MMKLVLFSIIIIAICMIFLSVNILLKKNGRFPKTHVSSSKAMRQRGVTCVQSQDYQERHKTKWVKE